MMCLILFWYLSFCAFDPAINMLCEEEKLMLYIFQSQSLNYLFPIDWEGTFKHQIAFVTLNQNETQRFSP